MFFVVTPPTRGLACGVRDHSHMLVASARRLGYEAEVREPKSLLDLMRLLVGQTAGGSVVIQWVFFGWNRFGLPLKFLIAGAVAQKLHRGLEFAIVIHELPANAGSISFRYVRYKLQWLLLKVMCEASGAVVVNQHVEASCLLDKHKRPPLFVPTQTNIPVVHQLPPSRYRAHDLVVFGTPARRRHIYAQLSRYDGADICGRRVREIHDIGEPFDELPRFVMGAVVRRLGYLSSAEVSRCLGDSWAGLYSAQFGADTKSGAFAAYCEHGVIPINIDEDVGQTRKKEPFLLSFSVACKTTEQEGLDRVRLAQAWIRSHRERGLFELLLERLSG